MISAFSRFAAQWKLQRMHRRTELALAGMPAELLRDIGFPAVELFPDGKSRFRRG